ncbi:MAG TPA: SagB/ThcOx family dehydrogenase [Anaerolineae bacterium]|nr:SagB/ThcOx family dehydrogenase [Anaerolineae bacterium]
MSNQDIQATWQYHDGTKHPAGRLMNPQHHFDPSRQPLLFKIYKDLPSISLPLDPSPSVPALEAIAGEIPAAGGESAPDLPAVARLLYFSAGITKYFQYPPPWGRIPFRAAACTGALYHIELYLVCGDLPDPSTLSPSGVSPLPSVGDFAGQGLEAGVYHFDPQALALRRLRRGNYRQALIAASAHEPGVARAPATFVLTDVVWRNAVKYQAREYRHAFWDSGTILANTLAVAAAQRLPARVVLGFVDAEVSRLLDLDPERELALALVPIGSAPNSTVPPAPSVTPLHLEIEPYSRRELDFPAIRAMHTASSLSDADAVAAWRSALPHLTRPAPTGPLTPLQPFAEDELPSEPIEKVIVRRGSTREFAREAISFRQLSTALDRALRGLNADFLESPEALLNDAYLIVNAVDGLAPGAYVYRRDRQALELLKAGNFRATAGHLALHQDLAADASVAIFFLADLPPILAGLGNRGYRAAQLDASLAAGRLYLAAYALGFGATGLTFFDDAATEFFSPHAQGKSAMFLIALGKKRQRP